MKHITALLLALSLCLFGFPLRAQAFDPEENNLANSWRYSDGELIVGQATASQRSTASHPDATLRGIDVSAHQGKIDWEAVKNSGEVDFVIIRCGYGMDQTDQDDTYFEYNASECERLGIPYGVYLYSYATNVERAESEAEHVLRLINGHELSYPVYFDMEDDSTIDADHAAIAATFCDKISAAGYPVGVYANLYWWTTYLTDACFDNWYRWVAQYNSTCGYTGEFAMWQYSNTGTVSGITGDVDLNYLIGSPADHGTAAVRHTYEEKITDPTCTEQGYTTHSCTICGNSYVDSYTEVTEHNYESSHCTVCGKANPDYFESELVVRISGAGRCETAIKAADEMKTVLGVEAFDTIILASGDSFADALAGSRLATGRKAPILLYRSSALELNLEYIVANLAENGTVYILGGTGAVPQDMEDVLKNTGIAVERLSGATRFDTNLAILQKAGVTGGEILVATGYNFADSLSASATGLPILMVNNNTGMLTDNQKAFLGSLEGASFTIIGGTAAVSQELENALQAYGSVERIYGKTREQTSVAVAERYFTDPQSIVLAYSRNFPDGLCGGPLAYTLGAPLILTNEGAETAAADYVAENGITRGCILGGTAVVSNASANIIFGSVNS